MAESSPWRVVARRAVLATLTRYGENALDVIHVVKERIGVIERSIPDGRPGYLAAEVFETMKVHDEAFVVMIDVHIRRRDVRPGRLFDEIVPQALEADAVCFRLTGSDRLDLLGRPLRSFPGKMRLSQLHTSGRMNGPRPRQRIGIGKSDIAALVIREIQIVPTKRSLHPIGHAYERRALNVLADARMSGRRDDRLVE